MRSPATIAAGLIAAFAVTGCDPVARPDTASETAVAVDAQAGDPATGATPAGTASPAAPAGVQAAHLWTSGEQQCELYKRKLIYTYTLARSPDPAYDWELLVDVKAEFNALNGWQQHNALFGIDYSLTFADGSTISGSPRFSGSRYTQSIAKGKNPLPVTARSFTLKGHGGPHGMEVVWPGSAGCVPS